MDGIEPIRSHSESARIQSFFSQLFDAAWKNGYDFTEPAYVEARQALNGLLRWSNTLSIPTLFISLYYFSGHKTEFSKASSRGLQDAVDIAMRLSIERTLHYLFLEGVTGLLVGALLAMVKTVRRGQQIRDSFVRKSHAILQDALAFGAPSLPVGRRMLLR